MHRIEQGRLDALPGSKALYSSWQELHAGLEAMLSGYRRIAMQYSPTNDIMYVSMVDAGTVEFLRSLGKEIVTSADLVSQFEAVLSEEQIASHQAAQRAIDADLSPKPGLKSAAACALLRGARSVERTFGVRYGRLVAAKPCAAKAWCGRTAPT